jgi:1-acyl-sn-glycerol-3-phosphate acyltransferase
LDALALIAAVPRELVYVAKAELERAFFSGVFLRRLGTLFVERFDVQRGAAARHALVSRIRRGDCLAFFPEGTFRSEPGLLPFRSGAFAAAAEAGVPVVPATIRGTRSILRAGSWFPHRGAVGVTVHPPLQPAGVDWPAVTALREQARAAILAGSGEPDRGG